MAYTGWRKHAYAGISVAWIGARGVLFVSTDVAKITGRTSSELGKPIVDGTLHKMISEFELPYKRKTAETAGLPAFAPQTSQPNLTRNATASMGAAKLTDLVHAAQHQHVSPTEVP